MKAETYARLRKLERKLERELDQLFSLYDPFTELMKINPSIIPQGIYDGMNTVKLEIDKRQDEYSELQRSLLEEDKVNNSK